MKKQAMELIIPFEINLIKPSVESAYRLLSLAPEKFEEITSTMRITVNRFNNEVYPTCDWAFLKVIQDEFPDKKLNCIVIEKFSNKGDCIKAVIDSVSRQMFSGPLYIQFQTLDERYLKSNNLSQRKYATVLNCSRSALKKNIPESKIQIGYPKTQEYDESLF